VTRWISVALSSVVTFGLASQALGQAIVLGVVPEGVVIDAATLPDLQPGARVGFRRADGSVAQIGEGSVLDVRDGRALVELQPGGTIQAGDLAVACASLTGSGSQADLRVSLQGLKTQLLSAGGGSVELQAALGQLESTLDTREAAILAGSCDVSPHDEQIAALTQQLQQLLAASPPSVTAAAPLPLPSSSADAPPLPLPAGSLPGGTTGQETVGALPLPGSSAAVGQGTASDGLAGALQFVQQIFQMAQSMGLMGGSSKGSAGQQPGSSFPPADVPVAIGPVQGTDSFVPSPPSPPPSPPVTTIPSEPSPPPVVSAPPSTPPPLPVTTPPSSPPPPVVSTPPSPPPPTTATPPKPPTRIVIAPPRLRLPGDRLADTPPAGGKPAEPPRTGDSRKPPEAPSARPPVREQWWTITPPKQSPVVAGTTPGTPSGSLPRMTAPGATKRSDDAPAAGTIKPPPVGPFRPALTPPPGTAGQPGVGSIARATPPSQRLAVVQGLVRTDNGAPVPGAMIAVGGKQVATNARGQFVVTDVPLGRQILVVTGRGFQPGRMALDVSSGEVEKVAVTLRRSLSPLQSP
jgi:hypothetical protein